MQPMEYRNLNKDKHSFPSLGTVDLNSRGMISLMEIPLTLIINSLLLILLMLVLNLRIRTDSTILNSVRTKNLSSLSEDSQHYS